MMEIPRLNNQPVTTFFAACGKDPNYFNFINFVKKFLVPYMTSHFIEEDYYEYLWENIWKERHDLMQLPRGHSKTECIGIWATIFLATCQPNNPFYTKYQKKILEQMLLAGDGEAKAQWSQRIKHFFYESPFLSWMIPEGADKRKQNAYWNESVMYLKNGHKILLRAIGEKAIRGNHVDRLHADDLVTENSPLVDQAIKEKWDGAVDGTTTNKMAMVQVTGTPLRYSDILFHLKDKGYHFIRLPAIKNMDKKEILSPKRWSWESLMETKKRIGSVKFQCNPGDAPILMSDFTYKNIRDIKIGDEIVGFKFGDGKKTRIAKSIVKNIFEREASTVKMKMSNGDNIICTPEHRWFTGRFSIDKIPNNHTFKRKPYLPAKINSKLIKISSIKEKITPDKQRLWDYLAGLIDGEGACKHGSISISQCPKKNPLVFNKIKNTLEKLGLDYTLNYVDKRRSSAKSFVINGGREIKAKIIRNSNPAKTPQILKTIYNRPEKIKLETPVIKEIKRYKKQKVYALETTTNNYVVWGYASKNSEYMLDPIDDSTSLIRRGWVEQCHNKRLNFFKVRPTNLIACYMGVDFAFEDRITSDRSAFVIIGELEVYDKLSKQNRKVYIILEIITRKGMSALEQFEFIKELHKKWSFDIIGLEENSIKAVAKHIPSFNLPIRRFWTGSSDSKFKAGDKQTFKQFETVGKKNLILRLGTRFEQKQIIIPYNSEETRIKADELTEECISFAQEEDKIVEIGVHPDIPIALAYALEGADRPRMAFSSLSKFDKK